MAVASEDTQVALHAAHELVKLVLEGTEGRGYVPLETLEAAARRYEEVAGHGSSSSGPITGIEERIDHAAWVLRRLVVTLGFQAELVVYGGDYEERGTHTTRDCRISLRRDIFEGEHLKALTQFADQHGCSLEINKHGASLRVSGRHLELAQADGVAVNSLTTGAAVGESREGQS